MGIIMCLVDVRNLENMKKKKEEANTLPCWVLLKLNPICFKRFWEVVASWTYYTESLTSAVAQSVVGLAS